MAKHQLVTTDSGRISSGYFYERNDCTVRALALAAKIPYAEAHSHLKAHGRKAGKGVMHKPLVAAYDKYVGEHHRTSVYKRDLPTVAAFITAHPVGTFIVNVRGHVFALIDGLQHDLCPALAKPRCRVMGYWVAK